MTQDKQLDYIQERVDIVVDRVADVNKSIEAFKTSFEHHMKQDELLSKEVARLGNTMHDNTASLKEHMRRTDLLEKYVKSVDARFTPIELEQVRRKAVYSWISSRLKFIAKLGAAISALGVLGLAAKQILEFLLM